MMFSTHVLLVLVDVAQRGALLFQDDTRHAETEEVHHSQDGTAADVQPRYQVRQLPEQSSGLVEAGSRSKQPPEHSANSSLFQGFLRLCKDDKTEEAQGPAHKEALTPVHQPSVSQGSGTKEKPAVLAEGGTAPPSAPQKSPLNKAASSVDGEAPHAPLDSPGVEIINEDFVNPPEQNDPPHNGSSLDFSGEDGVYRAKPIVIYETDDSLTESQPPDDNFASTPSSQAVHDPSEGAPPPFLAGNAVEVSKQREEEEHATPGARSSTLTKKLMTSQSVLRPSLGQTPPHEMSCSLSRNSDRSPLRTLGNSEDLEPTEHQHQVKAQSQERPLSASESHSPKLKRQQEEVRRGPSKTCHPRVLPRESTGPQTPRLKGSPLKTFPINIEVQSTIPEECLGRPTPVPRQRSPSHQAKQTVLADAKNISDISSFPSKAEEGSVSYVTGAGSSTAPQPGSISEKSLPCLARACVPQDYQHYLGPQEKAFVPSFNQEKSTFADLSDPTEDGIPSGVRVTDAILRQGITTGWNQ